jgi:hypothetical protein
MPVAYKVTVSTTNKEGTFHITWMNLETHEQERFGQSSSDIMPEEVDWLWKDKRNQLRIGEKLYRFLDGEGGHLNRALKEADAKAESLHIFLTTCNQTANWPFELLAKDGLFLLSNRLHLVRGVPDSEATETTSPQNRPLKLLFLDGSIPI